MGPVETFFLGEAPPPTTFRGSQADVGGVQGVERTGLGDQLPCASFLHHCEYHQVKTEKHIVSL